MRTKEKGRDLNAWLAGDEFMLPNEPNLTLSYLMAYTTLGIRSQRPKLANRFIDHIVKLRMKVQFQNGLSFASISAAALLSAARSLPPQLHRTQRKQTLQQRKAPKTQLMGRLLSSRLLWGALLS